MPLIEPVARCHKFNSLNRTAQWFYLQLKTVLDPAGRHDAHPSILNSALFPLRKDVRDTDITRWMAECHKAGLLRCYTDTKSRSVVEVYDARQRMKFLRSEFDPPDGQQNFALSTRIEKKGREQSPPIEKKAGVRSPELESPSPDKPRAMWAPRAMWQLLRDEKELRARLAAERESTKPDAVLIESLRAQLRAVKEEMKGKP